MFRVVNLKGLYAVLAGVLVFACLAGVASAAEEKIGFVDPQYLLTQHPKYEQTIKQLNQGTDAKIKEARDAMSKEKDEEKKGQIYRAKETEASELEQKMMRPLIDEVTQTIGKVAKEKGVTVVFNKGLVFFGGLDLTDDVVKALKAKK